MEENKAKGFKIFGDEEPVEEEVIIPLEEEVEPVAAPSSSSKPLVLALFAFCILGVLLFLGYYQLTNRINRMESTGTHEIKGLNREVDARLTGLSANLTEQNTQFTKRIDELANQVASVSKQSQKNASAIASTEKALTTTKQSASSTLTDLEARLSALVDRLDSTESAVAKSISGFNDRIGTLKAAVDETRQTAGSVAQIRQDMETLQTRLNSMASEYERLRATQTDSETLRQQIAGLEQQLNRRLEATEKKLQQSVASLGDDIVALEAMMKSFKNMAQSQSAGQNTSGNPNIIEQEIK